MAKGYLYTKKIWMPVCCLAAVFVFCALSASFSYAQDTTVETQIGVDQILGSKKETPKEVPSEAPKEANVTLPIADAGGDLSLEEKQIMLINKSLKNMVEENKKLIDEKKTLENELGNLRGQNEIRGNRINALTRQRDNLEDRLKELETQQNQYASQIKDLKAKLEERQAEFDAKLNDMEEKQKEEELAKQQAMQKLLPTLKNPKRTSDVKTKQNEIKKQAKENLDRLETTARKATSRIEELSRENKELTENSARLHYNMGNFFFDQGNFVRAEKEYKKVVELMPYDPAAHYNLAFVAGEFLNDRETSLKHYKKYLFLEPKAEDAPLVKEKILELEMELKATIDSPLENPDLRKK